MPSNIKILLKEAKSSTHSVYQELIDYPPKNCTYLNSLSKNLSIDRLLNAGAYYCNLPNMGIAPKNADLIHSHQQLILNKTPWVVDFEHVSAFVYFHHQGINSKINKKIIEKYLSSRYCKKIMPWCIAAKKSLENAIDISKFEDKIVVVYPAIHKMESVKTKNDRVNLLFIGRYFQRKGGLETLKSFEILAKKYDVALTIVSNIPSYIIKKYKDFNNIYFYGLLPREVLFEKYFPQSDILVFPTQYDTFGMVFLEAMAFALPIVSLYNFATPEIIENGKNGYLIKPYSKLWFGEDYLLHPKWGDWNVLKTVLSKNEQNRIVKDLVEKLAILIEDDSLRRKMGENSSKMIESGKFSITERNKKLERIYKEAIE